MTYSYTEKKRIRKNFGKRENVLDIPYLLAIQLDSYNSFIKPNDEESGLELVSALIPSSNCSVKQ